VTLDETLEPFCANLSASKDAGNTSDHVYQFDVSAKLASFRSFPLLLSPQLGKDLLLHE
jgi:hypothetical protein